MKIVKKKVLCSFWFYEFAQSHKCCCIPRNNKCLSCDILRPYLCAIGCQMCGMESLSMRVPASSRLRHWYCGKLPFTPHAHRKNHILDTFQHIPTPWNIGCWWSMNMKTTLQRLRATLRSCNCHKICKARYAKQTHQAIQAPRQISLIEIHSTYVGYVWWEVWYEIWDVATKSEESHTAMRGMKCAHTKLQTFIHSKKCGYIRTYILTYATTHTLYIRTYVHTYIPTYSIIQFYITYITYTTYTTYITYITYITPNYCCLFFIYVVLIGICARVLSVQRSWSKGNQCLCWGWSRRPCKSRCFCVAMNSLHTLPVSQCHGA